MHVCRISAFRTCGVKLLQRHTAGLYPLLVPGLRLRTLRIAAHSSPAPARQSEEANAKGNQILMSGRGGQQVRCAPSHWCDSNWAVYTKPISASGN